MRDQWVEDGKEEDKTDSQGRCHPPAFLCAVKTWPVSREFSGHVKKGTEEKSPFLYNGDSEDGKGMLIVISTYEHTQLGGNGGQAGMFPEAIDQHTTIEVLHYNQNLVQLADSNAGNLIIINSIFMASVTSFAVHAKGGSMLNGLEQLLQFGFLVSSVVAIFLCLQLIMTKGNFTEKIRYLDLVFFGDIMHRKNSDGYIFEFTKAKPKHILHNILRRIYQTSLIADRKFAYCRLAQNWTLASSIRIGFSIFATH